MPAGTRRSVVRRRATLALTALLAVGAVAAGAVRLIGLPGVLSEPVIHTVVFPPGATFSIDTDVFAGIPHRQVDRVVWLEFELGDTLVVRNDDLFNHTLWAINVRPGETVGYTFTELGTFSGECTFDLTVFLEVRPRTG